MEIAYSTIYDSMNENAWSGSAYHMHQSLVNAGLSVKYISNLKRDHRLFFALKKQMLKYLLNKNYVSDREETIVRSYSAQIRDRFGKLGSTLLFGPSSIPFAYVGEEIPYVFWTDATFAGMIDFYPNFTNFSKGLLKHGHKMEQMALKNCKLAIFSSDWAAETAINYYDVSPEKVKIVPFGANLNRPNNIQPETILKKKKFTVCKLMFMAVEWSRKGGDKAIEIVNKLNQNGQKAELHIVGCQPPYPTPDYVKIHGYLNKNNPKEFFKIEDMFISSHFFLLPTKADCVPVVLAEASSYGLPSLTSNVGGISTAIRQNLNGFTFDLNSSSDDYVNCITHIFNSKDVYQKLVFTTINEYNTRLNWKSAGQAVHHLLESLDL